MTIFYYLFAPFILIALALLPISYGAWIGWQAGSRPRMALLLHLMLAVCAIFLLTPVSLVGPGGSADYGSYWPVPLFAAWFLGAGHLPAISPEARQAYREMAMMMGGATLLCLGAAYCVHRLAAYLARKLGR